MNRQQKPIRHGKGWRVRPIDHNGKRQSLTFPSYQEALFALQQTQSQSGEVKRGIRPAPPPVKKFTELAEFYKIHFSDQKRNFRAERSIIDKHLVPYFGSMLLSEVGRHIAEFKLQKRHLSDKTLHNILTLLISMLRVAKFDKGWLLELPQIRKPRVTLIERDFRFLKSRDEIQKFLSAASDVSPALFALYASAIFTGMRAGELSGLQWEDIDFTKRQITVRRSYDGPTKSGKSRIVPILDALLPVLRSWFTHSDAAWVFPNSVGNMHCRSSRIFQEDLQRVLDLAGFQKVWRRGKLRGYIVFHALRHTFASHWMMNGGDIFRLQKILGHASSQITERYSHFAPEAFSEDYGRFPFLASNGPLLVAAK
jgi:integrase